MIATFGDGRRDAGRPRLWPLLVVLVTLASLGAAESCPAAEPEGVAVSTPDPLAGTDRLDPAKTWPVVDETVASMLPARSDTAADWITPLEPLHFCGEPRLLPTCVPPPPCHPALPPQPFDLVGMRGKPTAGPIYRGPCAPRTGSHDCGPCPRAHRVHDRVFDWFYNPRTPIFP